MTPSSSYDVVCGAAKIDTRVACHIAMAVIINVLTGISLFWGVAACTVVVVIYTYVGGMWAVSITDFVQTIMIIVGILALAWEVNHQAGGPAAVFASQPDGFFRFVPEWNLDHIVRAVMSRQL